MPEITKTEEEVVQYILSAEGAIGYINSATPHEGVKVIEVK